ncbi:hypothetical protein INR49_012116 [Caranx melampygus]|nr:hypothetical protein INR49_012116 [Caranx melampygus]
MESVRGETVCFVLTRMIVVVLFVSLLCFPFNSTARRNDRPIIGILAQEVFSPKPNQTSYIAASYVKFLEAAGARVVPVMINQPLKDYRALFNSINGGLQCLWLMQQQQQQQQQQQIALSGTVSSTLCAREGPEGPIEKPLAALVLYPGGSASITSSGYQRAAKIFYDLAIEANDRGDYFPVWGTCLGFEQLTVLTSGKKLLTRTNTSGVALPLVFTNETNDSRVFKGFPPELMKDLETEPLTENAHKWSVTTSTFNTNEELKKFYKIITTNTDGNIEFVSTMEGNYNPAALHSKIKQTGGNRLNRCVAFVCLHSV